MNCIGKQKTICIPCCIGKQKQKKPFPPHPPIKKKKIIIF